MITQEQLQELKFNQTVYVCIGPGDFPQQGLCSYQGIITAKTETSFGFSIEITITESRYDGIEVGSSDYVHSIGTAGKDLGIGAYVNA